MINELIACDCLNIERILVLKAKKLHLTGEECHILLLIYALKKADNQVITPATLQNYTLLKAEELNKVLQDLLDKKFIYNHGGSITLVHLEKRLLQTDKTKDKKTEPINLVALFEEQFGRSLSSIELNIIREWKESNFDDEMIVKALKEAVKSQVLNFRYIEGILNNWASNGIKQRYVETKEPERTVQISEYKWWEDE